MKILNPKFLIILISLIFSLTLTSIKSQSEEENTYPLIGILSVPQNAQEFPVNNTGLINANYVRWLESNGMESIAIHPWYTPDKLDSILVKLNGIIIQGENSPMENFSAYYKTVKQIIENVKKFSKTDPSFNFPIFGVCGGFGIMANVLEGDNILTTHEDIKSQSNLIFDENEIIDTQLFNQIPSILINVFKNTKSIYENHKLGISPEKFTSKNSKIKEYMNIVALSTDKDGKNYVSAAEGIKDFPFFGVQFHPEIIAFDKIEDSNVPDSYEAILGSKHFGHFLLKKSENSKNVFENYRENRNYMTNRLPDVKDISGAYYYRFNQNEDFE
jgi:gamma-glutamyl-gamma-aminobutyrate hydrolase PuuD